MIPRTRLFAPITVNDIRNNNVAPLIPPIVKFNPASFFNHVGNNAAPLPPPWYMLQPFNYVGNNAAPLPPPMVVAPPLPPSIVQFDPISFSYICNNVVTAPPLKNDVGYERTS